MMTDTVPDFTILGAGLAGPLMALYLAQEGYRVDVYEKRPDPRTNGVAQGKSINLALSKRALFALEEVGLVDEVMQQAIPMRGRMLHSQTGKLSFQTYGINDQEVLNSISRSLLNITLLKAAEKVNGIRFFFDQQVEKINLQEKSCQLADSNSKQQELVQFQTLVGADGAFSVLRYHMQKLDRFNYEQYFIDHGYKELVIPAQANGEFALDKNALHIWPRGDFMLIALPNLDSSFTCTLFAPFQGKNSFSSLTQAQEVEDYFKTLFPDVLPLAPTLISDFFNNPTGSLVSIKCYPWSYQDQAILIGDACHATVPFYGQGINAGFEDCTLLTQFIKKHSDDLELAFQEYQLSRKVDTDTLAEISFSNYIEMRDSVRSPLFLARRLIENLFHKLFPQRFYPLHSIVSFTRTPYSQAVQHVRNQYSIIGLALSIALLVGFVKVLKTLH
ncbi:MAG: FAD-dependent monooxygenase [Symploca sp. SIO1C2]|nr:FAD-dependent monooxygenase [Symploca sp. SIO1C2]